MKILSDYIKKKFGVSPEKYLEVLKMSPGAEGYLLGSIGELLFKEYAEANGYEALRIKEKPEGGNNAKSDEARGDFYIRKKGSTKDEWLVIECKGVKSNAEKRSGLTKISSCVTALVKHTFDRKKHVESIYKSGKTAYENAKIEWEKKNDKKFPAFAWSTINPGAGIPDLGNLWKDKEEIKSWLDTFDAKDFDENAFGI